MVNARYRDPTYYGACQLERHEIRQKYGCTACQRRVVGLNIFGCGVCNDGIDREPGYDCRGFRIDEDCISDH